VAPVGAVADSAATGAATSVVAAAVWSALRLFIIDCISLSRVCRADTGPMERG
jgi:hypothetical protein